MSRCRRRPGRRRPCRRSGRHCRRRPSRGGGNPSLSRSLLQLRLLEATAAFASAVAAGAPRRSWTRGARARARRQVCEGDEEEAMSWSATARRRERTKWKAKAEETRAAGRFWTEISLLASCPGRFRFCYGDTYSTVYGSDFHPFLVDSKSF